MGAMDPVHNKRPKSHNSFSKNKIAALFGFAFIQFVCVSAHESINRPRPYSLDQMLLCEGGIHNEKALIRDIKNTKINYREFDEKRSERIINTKI